MGQAVEAVALMKQRIQSITTLVVHQVFADNEEVDASHSTCTPLKA